VQGNHKIWLGTTLEVGPEFAPNEKVGLKTHDVMNLLMKFQNKFQTDFQNLIESRLVIPTGILRIPVFSLSCGTFFTGITIPVP
jgi:hypothetical protein